MKIVTWWRPFPHPGGVCPVHLYRVAQITAILLQCTPEKTDSFPSAVSAAAGKPGRRRGAAVDQLQERLPKVVRQEGVQYRVHAGVHVREDVRRDLEGDANFVHRVRVQRLEHEDDLDRTPADCEEGDHDYDEARDALFPPHRLGGSVALRSDPEPKFAEHD